MIIVDRSLEDFVDHKATCGNTHYLGVHVATTNQFRTERQRDRESTIIEWTGEEVYLYLCVCFCFQKTGVYYAAHL